MIRILCDFDGVLTTQIDEAHQVKEYFCQEMERLSKLSRNEVQTIVQAGEKALLESPEKHGWYFNNRISAFANEDFFIRNNALAFLLDDIANGRRGVTLGPLDRTISIVAESLIDANVLSFTDLVLWAFQQMSAQTQKKSHKPLDPIAAQTLRVLVERNIQLTIVSNSGTDRIRDILSAAELENTIEVRGNARKFELGNDPNTLHIGPYNVPTDRPIFEEIIMDIQPDIFIGDVFSLDLALPLHLIESGKLQKRRGLCLLRTQSYTPNWSLGFCKSYSGPKAQIGLLNSFDELLTWIGTA